MNPKKRFPTLATYKLMRNKNSVVFFELEQKKRTPKIKVCKLLTDKTTRRHVNLRAMVLQNKFLRLY